MFYLVSKIFVEIDVEEIWPQLLSTLVFIGSWYVEDGFIVKMWEQKNLHFDAIWEDLVVPK